MMLGTATAAMIADAMIGNEPQIAPKVTIHIRHGEWPAAGGGAEVRPEAT